MASSVGKMPAGLIERNYENAINIIGSRKRRARPDSAISSVSAASSAESLERMPDANGSPSFRGTPSLRGMSEWLEALGHRTEDVDALNVVHVAGTKGKGSTCAFTESLLRAHGERVGYPHKIGLYTSPHLISPEERIRINGKPLAKELLATYFFEIYDRLPQLAHKYEISPGKSASERGPRFLQLWALLAFHTFIREKVDATIVETHNGGEYDATTVIRRPIVTAITTLGMDHIEMLGPSIQNIAWHKSGIFKPGAVALSTIQDPAPAAILEKRAHDRGEKVRFVAENDHRLPPNALQLKPTVQRKNASLGAAAADEWLSVKTPQGQGLSIDDIRIGIERWSWPGRFQVINDQYQNRTWFLDAAHNDMSVALAASWFAETAEALLKPRVNTPVRVLIFSHINELRDTTALIRSLARALLDSGAGVEHVIFSTYNESTEGKWSQRSTSPELSRETWEKVDPHCQIWDEPTIEGAIRRAKQLASDKGLQTLITGSQHLVGPALNILLPEQAR